MAGIYRFLWNDARKWMLFNICLFPWPWACLVLTSLGQREWSVCLTGVSQYLTYFRQILHHSIKYDITISIEPFLLFIYRLQLLHYKPNQTTDDDCEHIWCLFLCFSDCILFHPFLIWRIINSALFSQLIWCPFHLNLIQFFNILMQSNCVLFGCLDLVNFLLELASDSISLGNPCQCCRLDLVHFLFEPALGLFQFVFNKNGSKG